MTVLMIDRAGTKPSVVRHQTLAPATGHPARPAALRPDRLALNSQGPARPAMVWMPSPNYNDRSPGTAVDTIIIHHTDHFPSVWSVGEFFQRPDAKASSHFIVGKDGTIVQAVAEDKAAWHAGVSGFAGRPGVSDFSVGIEILNDGDNKDPFTPPQMDAVIRLVAYLAAKYKVPAERIIGHKDIALPEGRKVDPGTNFDWKQLMDGVAARVPGWRGRYTPPAHTPPPAAELARALRDADPARRQQAALTAARFHMRGELPQLQAMVGDTVPAVRAAAVYALGVLDDQAARPTLEAALRSSDGHLRKLAMDALIHLGVFSDDQLRAMLADPDLDVQRGAMVVLGTRHDAAAIPLLRARLRQPGEPETTLHTAISALVNLDDAASAPDLAAILADRSRPPAVRVVAADALGGFKATAGYAALAAATAPAEDGELRAAAVWALRWLADPRVSPRLAALARDPDPAVSAAATEALQELRGHGFSPTELLQRAHEAAKPLLKLITPIPRHTDI